jgi:uncharacterized protein YbjT (DUF2867 family)
VVRDPYPEAAWFPIHERDIADVATAALLEDGHAGAAYTVSGPELITRREQVRAIASAIGEDIRFEEVTPERARDLYRRQGGFAAANADFLLGFADYSGAASDPESAVEWKPAAATGQPTAERVTGRPARTFAQWARDRVRDFL